MTSDTIKQAVAAIRAGANQWIRDASATARADGTIEWYGDAEAQAEYQRLMDLASALEAVVTPAPAAHIDDDAVDHFAVAMKEKLAQARAKGRSGWHGCNPADLSRMLREHVDKGDPRDVANFCMFLWSLGQPISAAPAVQAAPQATIKQSLQVAAPQAGEDARQKCWCESCRPITTTDMRMVLCPTCGNKRCPHAANHRNACTSSNEPGQKGSSYEHCSPPEEDDGPKPVFVLPPTVARIVRNVFLPANPNKLRTAHPDTVAAAKHYIEALEAFEARAALTTQGASRGD